MRIPFALEAPPNSLKSAHDAPGGGTGRGVGTVGVAARRDRGGSGSLVGSGSRCLAFAASVVILLFSLPAAAVTITLALVPGGSVAVGNTVEVEVSISGLDPEDLQGFELDIIFDDSLAAFQPLATTFGDELGAPVLTDAGLRPVPKDDQAFFAQTSILDLTGQPDAFLLGTLTFLVTHAGILEFSLGSFPTTLSPVLSCGAAGACDPTFNPESVSSVSVLAVPEPALALLVASGLLSLALYHRRTGWTTPIANGSSN